MLYEILVKDRPVSLQTKNRTRLDEWKRTLFQLFTEAWGTQLSTKVDFHVTIVYLCGTEPVDVDNIIKPILDAMVGVLYVDDTLVTDVDSHRRPNYGLISVTDWPPKLIEGLALKEECVYIRVRDATDLGGYL